MFTQPSEHTMNNHIRTIAAYDLGGPLETFARQLAELVAYVYTLGYVTGEWVHRTNDQLARLWASLWVGTTEQVTEQAPCMFAAYRAKLEGMTVQELRRMARHCGLGRSFYRTARKAQLIDALEVFI
jgi:hypothetical protein